MTVFARKARAVAGAGAAVAITLTMSGCQSAQPSSQTNPISDSQVRILVNPDSERELVIGEIYMQSLEASNRSVRLVPIDEPTPEKRIEALLNGQVDLVVGCTGNFLDYLDPVRAGEIEEELRNEPEVQSGKDFLAETHIAMMGALTPNLMTVEPSTAQGCLGQETTDLPQNYVPIFSKDLFDRAETGIVSSVTKFLAVRDLDWLTAQTKETGSAARVVKKWSKNHTIDQEGFDNNGELGDTAHEDAELDPAS
ncbi:hypothetical protein CPHO_07800 [Corynebacterium phocae]|uniref:ABC-type glycine betaine transport system substrate-binding domain-containing protein n=1 Tax=Corynebacterium phocae TaxID=161895 RepID=A0A1L7D3W0_9CORY|nr:hypothetical protein [Corynebacterium phocae]APT92808.1 hypothetical protein CPHO_07800 [Corynebacterium phocae]KAA8723122.1 hypothetical protein F4V58_07300 [Corynebacterium phocae]